jgi:putative membrane protein
LHFSSILFDLASHGRELLMPALFGFVGAASGSWFWGVIAMVAFGFAVLRTLIRYFTLRYRITDQELQLNEGLIFHNQRTVPLGRIQNIDLRQNLLHRWFGVAEVKIETASGKEAEAVLRVLTSGQIAALRAAVFGRRAAVRVGLTPIGGAVVGPVVGSAERAADPGVPVEAIAGDERWGAELAAPEEAEGLGNEPVGELLLQIPWTWLVWAGVASNRGWLMVGLALGAVFQFDVLERWLPDRGERWLALWRFDWSDLLGNALTLAGVFVAGFVILKLLGVIWYLYRFAGYRLERVGSDLRVSAGLVSRYSASIPQQRVQLISLHQPWVLGWWGMASIRIETAGGAGGGEESEDNVSRSWFVPVVPLSLVPGILSALRPGEWSVSERVTWRGTAGGTRSRLTRLAVVVSALALGVGYWLWGLAGLAGGVLIALHQFWYAWRRSRSLQYARTSDGVAFRSGIFYRKTSYTFFERLQTLRWEQSPFDRRWGMATLVVDTAAAGPADHLIRVPYLDAAWAREELLQLQAQAARHHPSGGDGRYLEQGGGPTRGENPLDLPPLAGNFPAPHLI